MPAQYKWIYGDQVANKLPGSDQNYYFRTATRYKVDTNGKPTGESETTVYYASFGQGLGFGWNPGDENGNKFNPGPWVAAAVTNDKGATFSYKSYTQADADVGKIPPGKNVGDSVLGATAQLSMSTRKGAFNETIQNNIINSATKVKPGLSQQLAVKLQNSASDSAASSDAADGGATDEGTPSETPVSSIVSEPINTTIESGYVRENYGPDENLKYPLVRSDDQDYIKFTMFKYDGRQIGEGNITAENLANFKPGDRRLKKLEGSVSLPIQPGITDSNAVEWGGANLSGPDAYLASLSMGAMNSNEGLTGMLSDLMGRVQKDLKEIAGSPDFQRAIKLYLAQEAVGVQGLLSRASGAIINPNLELLFNGPSLRPFNFTFRLSPRSAPEAANVKRIIRFFKQGMSVKTAASSIFLKAPNIFDIKYISSGKDHPSLNRIKQCALLGCDVDYTPDGTYMTFNDEDKTMTSYQITLRFSELDPIYEEDYKDNGLTDTQIGY